MSMLEKDARGLRTEIQHFMNLII